jgi:hypothetical protein
MANRFARRIRDGAIRTLGDLKTEFKALAKALHPDLAGHAAGEEFIHVRSEYEAALRDFELHRFRTRSGRIRPGSPAGGETVGAVPAVVFTALGILRKRGFPKTPRHEKERYRYEYARYRFQTALEKLGEGRGADLEPAERALIDLCARKPSSFRAVLSYLDGLTEYSARDLPAMRTSLVLESRTLGADPGIPDPVKRFLGALAETLGLGAVLPDP